MKPFLLLALLLLLNGCQNPSRFQAAQSEPPADVDGLQGISGKLHEAARVHHAGRRHGGDGRSCARAAAGDAGDRGSPPGVA